MLFACHVLDVGGDAMKCENCQHYYLVNELEGMCRFNPPAIGANGKGVWAAVFFDDKCGSYAECLEWNGA